MIALFECILQAAQHHCSITFNNLVSTLFSKFDSNSNNSKECIPVYEEDQSVHFVVTAIYNISYNLYKANIFLLFCTLTTLKVH